MSLKVYIDEVVQDFRLENAGDIQFGLEDSPTFKLLPIYDAKESGSEAAPVSITAVRISKNLPYPEIERIDLAIDLIIFDSSTNQYIIDNTKSALDLLTKGLFFLEFSNGYNKFTTGPFNVTVQDYPLTWDLEIISFDSEETTFDETDINI